MKASGGDGTAPNEDNDESEVRRFRAFKVVRVIVICGALSVYGIRCRL